MKLFFSLAVLLISFQSFDCYGRLNFFDVDLLRYAAGDKRGNIMVSPASIRTTLAMLLQGAKNVTAKEIRNALRLSWDENDRKMELATYLNALQLNSSSTVVQSANGVFVSNKLPLKKDFETVLKRDFSSEITKMDFDNTKKSVDLMNDWVNQKTFGHIPTIVEPEQLVPNMKMILANALYFKGTWKYNFDVQNTHGECFYRSDDCQKVTMMELETSLPYVYVDDVQAHALELPYEGGRYSMILLVPIERGGCEALIRDLSFVRLPQIRNLMRPTEMILTMPKFTVNYNGDMVEPLSNMHIKSLFSDNANLSGIFEASTATVNAFQHKVFMSVDEKGTVAAAVSSAVVVPLSFGELDIKIDRPFVFFIRDNHLGIVLFEGKIEEPTAFVEPKTPVGVLPLKPNVLLEPVKTSSNAPATSSNAPATSTAPAAPVANGPKEVYTPIVFPRSNFDSQTPVTSTTEKTKTFYDSIKSLFG